MHGPMSIPSDATVEILLVTDACPDADAIQQQILMLDRQIEATTNDRDRDILCAVFQALNWARSPTGFAPWVL